MTTNAYDALNRLTQKTYSDQSEIATYGYDVSTQFGVSFANPVGRMVYEKLDYPGSGPQNSTWSTFSYDQMGRIASQGNCFPSPIAQCQSFWTVNANHNLLGDLISLMYPDGRVVKTYNNGAARPTQVTFDNFNGTSVNYNYLSAAHYAPDGSPASTLMGNGVSETSTYNSRLQPCNQQIATGSSPWVNRTYSFYSSPTCTGSGGDNGNVMQIADNLQNGRTQNFTYDPLNRLASAATQATSGPDCWGNSYVYDQWANLTQQNVSQCSGAYMNLSIDGNNHITNTGFAYDAAGNLTLNSPISYQYDAENRLVNFSSGAGVYTYDAEGNRVQKQAGGVTTDYIYFGGQPIAEYNPTTGDYSDYIYANGRRLVRADTYDTRILITGNTPEGSGWQYEGYNFSGGSAYSGYVIQSGDKLYVRQYQNSTACGGVDIGFSDGTRLGFVLTDSDGYLANEDGIHNAWHFRQFDLTSYAGKTISQPLVLLEGCTQPGDWQIYFSDFVLVSADGTVRPIYARDSSVSLSMWGSSAIVNPAYQVNTSISAGDAMNAAEATTYYHQDQLGSSRLLTGGGGWPVSSATFLPFGEEWNPQATVNHYKFTGKERDDESNLDNFGARYLTSTYGRFMSPDPGNTGAHPALPQSWNMYIYALNNPLNNVDPDGLDPCTTAEGAASPAEGSEITAGDCEQKARQASSTPTALAGAIVLGAAKAFDNQVIDLANTIKAPINAALSLLGINISDLGQMPDIQASNTTEQGTMNLAGPALIAGTLLTGEGEAVSGVKVAKSLASDAQVAEQGAAIAGRGSPNVLRDAQRLAAQYGGDAADWSKMTSSTYQAPGTARSTAFATHWYENAVEGIRTEYKTVIVWMRQ